MKTDNPKTLRVANNPPRFSQTDPFEVAMRELELRGETLDRTLQQQVEFFGPDDEEIVREYLNRRGE